MATETLAERFISNEIATLVLTDALVGIGDRLGTPKYGLVKISVLQALLNAATATLTNKTFDLDANTLTGSLAEFNTALQSDSFFPLSGGVTVTGEVIISGLLRSGGAVKGISGGVMTATSNYHAVDTENLDPTDDLDTINGFEFAATLILHARNSSRLFTLKHGTGNVTLAGGVDFISTSKDDTIMLIYTQHSNSWIEISRSDNTP